MVDLSRIAGGPSIPAARTNAIKSLIGAGRTGQALNELQSIYPTNAVVKNLIELHDAIQKAERTGNGGTQAIRDASDKITMAALKLAENPNHQPGPISVDLTAPVAEPVNLRPVGVAGVPIADATFRDVQSKLADGKIEDALKLLASAQVNDVNGLINLRAEVATMQRGALSGVGTQHLKFDAYAQLLGQALSFAYQGRPQRLQIDSGAIQRAQAELGSANGTSRAINILRAAVTSPSATLDLLAGIGQHIQKLENGNLADSRDLGPMQATLNMEVIGLVGELGRDINHFQAEVEPSSIESPPVMVVELPSVSALNGADNRARLDALKSALTEVQTAFDNGEMQFLGELRPAAHQQALRLVKSLVGTALESLQPSSEAYQETLNGYYRFLAGLESSTPQVRGGGLYGIFGAIENATITDIGPLNADAPSQVAAAIDTAEQRRANAAAFSQVPGVRTPPLMVIMSQWDVEGLTSEFNSNANDLAAGRRAMIDAEKPFGRTLPELIQQNQLPLNPYTGKPGPKADYI